MRLSENVYLFFKFASGGMKMILFSQCNLPGDEGERICTSYLPHMPSQYEVVIRYTKDDKKKYVVRR